METIQEKYNKSNRVIKIRSGLMLKGLTIRKWAENHNLPYSLVYQVVMGECGKLQSPFTKSYAIQQIFKSEGLWPDEEVKAV